MPLTNGHQQTNLRCCPLYQLIIQTTQKMLNFLPWSPSKKKAEPKATPSKQGPNGGASLENAETILGISSNSASNLIVPSKDKVGHHNRMRQDLVQKTSVTTQELEKILCYGCKGVPLQPSACLSCKKTFCVEYLIPQLNSNKRCPNCGANILGGTPLQTTKSDSLFEHNKQPLVASDKLDSDTKMIFEKVRVVCPNREKDCSQILSLRDVKDHFEKNCLMKCNHCYKEVLNQDGERHLQECQEVKEYEKGKERLSIDFTRGIHKQQLIGEDLRYKFLDMETKLKDLQLESQFKEIKVTKMKLVTIFLLIVTAIHVHLYQQSTDRSQDSIREVKTILDRDLPNTMFVKREEFLNMNAIEIYLNHTLNILKDHASQQFSPPLRQDSRFKIHRYADQLTQHQVFVEELSQILFFNKTLSLTELDPRLRHEVDCLPQQESQMGRTCLMKPEKNYLKPAQLKAISQMTNFIENPEDATKNVKRLFRTLFDSLRKMVPSDELDSTLYQVQKLLKIED